jgi:hypothetical protein
MVVYYTEYIAYQIYSNSQNIISSQQCMLLTLLSLFLVPIGN